MIELFLCAAIWGASFVAQKLGSRYFGPFTINCYRELLAAVFLLGCVRLRDRFAARVRGEVGATQLQTGWNRDTLVGGTLSGLLTFAAELVQQFGVERSMPGVAAFLTTNYVLFIPVFGIFLGRRAGFNVWGGVALALVGTYLLCVQGADVAWHVGAGEGLVLLCAVFFAFQMMVVERFIRTCDLLRFSFLQVAVAGLVNLPFVFLPGEMARTSWDGFVRGISSILFLGILSSGVAYSLQNRGQAKVSASVAAIITSLEGVFATGFGWLVLGNVLTLRQLLGCAFVLAAVLFSQLRFKSASVVL